MLKNAGFTLIELLVVILIIGVLAAVALPQYEKAVEKSRLATVYPLVKTLVSAEEAYFLANGEYTCDLSRLDVSLDFGESFSQGYFTGTITGRQTDKWQIGCVDNVSWKSIRAIRLGGKYPIMLQYSLTPWDNTKPGWYCVETAVSDRFPCRELLGVPESAKKVVNWFGRWYALDVK